MVVSELVRRVTVDFDGGGAHHFGGLVEVYEADRALLVREGLWVADFLVEADLTLTGLRMDADGSSLEVDGGALRVDQSLDLVEAVLLENDVLVLFDQLLVVLLALLIEDAVLEQAEQKDEKDEEAD